MNTIRDYFPLVLVLVAVVTDMGAEGKNSLRYLLPVYYLPVVDHNV